MTFLQDITARRRSEDALRQAQAEVELGIRQRGALEERQRLARDLHDSVSQAMYGISLGVNSALTFLDTDRGKVLEALNYTLELVHIGLKEIRALIFELRPESLETEGLVIFLTRQMGVLRARHDVEVELSLCDEPEASFEVKEAVYRIALEAVQNAVRHARSDRLDVSLTCERDSFALEVCDNGIGFEPLAEYSGYLGLHSMRERAQRVGGSLSIVSAPGCGAQIVARFPIPAAQEAQP